MKIKNILYIAALGLTATACTDGNDWSVDSAFDRLFGVNSDKISVTAEDLTAEVTFNSIKGAEYYIIEVSTDSLYDEVEMGGSHSKVYGTNKEVTTSPYTLEGLVGDTRYYLRMKSMADGKNDSKWCYYKNGETFKTKAEQIFYEITDADRFEDHIDLKWNAEMEATNIVVICAEEEIQNITLDANAKAAGEITVSGLNPSTTPLLYIMVRLSAELSLRALRLPCLPVTSRFSCPLLWRDSTRLSSTMLWLRLKQQWVPPTSASPSVFLPDW